jgi:hypothetical protein
LNPKCDILVSKFAFKCNLYCYAKEHIWALWVAGLRGAIAFALASSTIADLVGLCKLNTIDLHSSKARGFNP